MKKYYFALGLLVATNVFAAESQYEIIIDAGSTNSRLHLFSYQLDSSVPEITDQLYKKNSLPLSSFKDHPNDAGASLKPILDDAVHYVKDHNINQALSINVYGTAGMRLLDLSTQQAIYANVKDYINSHYANTFTIRTVKTITGTEEALFDWLDVNYVAKHFQELTPTVGAIDMGGASTQIAFATDNRDKPDDLIQLNINSHVYSVFVKSFLGLGEDQARGTINTYATASACYPTGYTPMHGQFNSAICANNYADLIQHNQVSSQMIPLPHDQTFIAFSGAYYTYQFFGIDNAPNKMNLQSGIAKECYKSWDQLQHEHPSDNYLINDCADASYLLELFYNTYQLQDNQLRIQQNIDWSLGALLYQLIAAK